MCPFKNDLHSYVGLLGYTLEITVEEMRGKVFQLYIVRKAHIRQVTREVSHPQLNTNMCTHAHTRTMPIDNLTSCVGRHTYILTEIYTQVNTAEMQCCTLHTG